MFFFSLLFIGVFYFLLCELYGIILLSYEDNSLSFLSLIFDKSSFRNLVMPFNISHGFWM